MEKTNNLYSTHIFMFPFHWDSKCVSKCSGKDDELNRFLQLISESNWKRKPLNIDSNIRYNESNYFYEFVQEAIYDTGNNSNNITHFEYNIVPDAETYNIECTNKTYRLLIQKIDLDIYGLGVGVLSFHLNNRDVDQSSEDDILAINQYGRRIYPPFLGIPTDIGGCSSKFDYKDFKFGVNDVKEKELAKSISLSFTEKETFQQYSDAVGFEYNNLFKLPSFIRDLFKKVPLRDQSNMENNQFYISIKPVLDDRMFVICWYGNSETTKRLQLNEGDKGKDADKKVIYCSDEWYYKYVFVDGGMKTCQNDDLAADLISKNINPRWLNYGTLYGVSRYSFMLLTASFDDLNSYNATFLINHMQSIYYKMILLVLSQRAMVLRFSSRINEINITNHLNDKDTKEKSLETYKDYRSFINIFYHREITAQEQGIELYDLLQRELRVGIQAKELEKEFQEMYHLIDMVAMNQTSSRMRLITILTGSIVIPNFILLLLNHRFFNQLPHINKIGGNLISAESVVLIAAIVISTLFIVNGLLRWNKKITYKKSKEHNVFKSITLGQILFSIGVLLVIIYLLFFQFFIGITW